MLKYESDRTGPKQMMIGQPCMAICQLLKTVIGREVAHILQEADHAVYHLTGHAVDHLTGHAVDHLTGHAVDHLTGHAVDREIDIKERSRSKIVIKYKYR